MSAAELDLQVAVEGAAADRLPPTGDFARWVDAALGEHAAGSQLTVRIVALEEGTALNEAYRPGKQGPTNVLTFPFESPPGVELPLLGDIVICAPVVEREAAAQGKDIESHWAHMVVHGCLHLRGYDHIEEAEAQEMESLETQVMAALGYSDPYKEQESA